MQVLIKPDVVIKEINERLFHVCISAWMVFQKYGVTPTITSANDGVHMAKSLHYKNMAWDFRVWGLPDPVVVTQELKNMLNIRHNDYDVIFEKDHIHIEYDPKG